MPITKLDLAKSTASASRQSVSDCERVIELFLDCVVSSVSRGHQVHLRRFANFIPRQRNPRPARNVHTGEAMSVPAHRVMVARMAVEL